MAVADNTEVELSGSDLQSTPWRITVDWTSQEGTALYLKNELECYVPLKDDLKGTHVKFPHCNILLMGPVGAGKSSFINTASSTFRGKLFPVARSGCADKSLTRKFSRYQINSSTSNRPMNFKLCDSRGLEMNNVMTEENMRLLLEGHLVDNVDFEPKATINQDQPRFKMNPNLVDKIHCVAIFVDASAIDSMPREVVQNIKDMQTVMNCLDVPQVVILTCVDKVCEKTKEAVSNIYRSQKIENIVAKVSETFGLARNNVFPMKNYENEGCVNTSVNILTMYTLKMMLDQADTHLYNQYDKIMKEYRIIRWMHDGWSRTVGLLMILYRRLKR